MSRRICLVLAGLLNVLLLGSPTMAAEPDESPAEQRMVVLRNGQTIEGLLSQKNGLYVIDFPDGQIRIKPVDVDVICNSIEDGYQRKRATIQPGNVHHHLELAQWCLRQRLMDLAKSELADATAADPTNPMIAVLRNRLEIAMEPPVQASSTRKPSAGPSNEDLDRMIRALPRESVEMFTESVQPVLMNHCAASDCHGPLSGKSLQFLRVPVGKTTSRRVTQRNLYSAISYVDRTHIVASPLLTIPLSPHGNMKHAVFTEHEAEQYKRLLEWVCVLAQQPVPETPATLPTGWPGSGSAPPQVLSQDARQAHPMPFAGNNSPSVKRGAAAMFSQPGNEAAKASFDAGSDPFDPEAFNRRHAPKKLDSDETETEP